MDNEAIHTSVDSVSEEIEPLKHSIDRKTNSANDTKHDSNDIETTSLNDRKDDTETPAPLLETLDARDAHPDRENGAIENFDMPSEEMVRGGWIMLNFQNIKQRFSVSQPVLWSQDHGNALLRTQSTLIADHACLKHNGSH